MSRQTEQKATITDVSRKLMADIEAGKYEAGDQLPARAALAVQYDLSKSAITCALKRVAEKYPLDFVPGRGVFLTREEAPRGTLRIGLIGQFATELAVSGSMNDMVASHSYFPPILQSVVQYGSQHNCAVLVIPNTGREPLNVEEIASYKLDCVISHGLTLRQETFLEFRRRGIPLLLGNRGDDSLVRLGGSYVDYDWPGSFRKAVQIFCEHGHRRVACCLAGVMSGGGAAQWMDAFCLEVVAHGLAYPVIDYCKYSAENDYPTEMVRQTRELLAMPDPPTAIFYKGPHHVLGGVFRTIEEHGLKIGKDIGVLTIGVRGTEASAPVSVLNEPGEILGLELARAAITLVEQPGAIVRSDVPFEYIDNGSMPTLGVRIERRQSCRA